MIRLAVFWFVLLASSPGQCRPDARFSKVRQLSGMQYQEGYKVLAYAEEEKISDLKQQTKSSRPLFSWDIIPPSSANLKALSSDIDMVPAVNVTSFPLKVPGPSGKMNRRKNRNRRKHSSPARRGGLLTNDTGLTDNVDRHLNKHGGRKAHGNHDLISLTEEERGSIDRIRESFRVTKERKRKNKHRKERTGKRKPKADRKKGERNRKREDKKLKRRGRKQKEILNNNNSLATSPNDKLSVHNPVWNHDSEDPVQLMNKMISENEHTQKIPTTENHIAANTMKIAVGDNNRLKDNFIDIKAPAEADSSEMNGVRDNILLPILVPSDIEGGKYGHRKQLNATYQRIDLKENSTGKEDYRVNSHTHIVKINGTVNKEHNNNSLPNNLDTNNLPVGIYLPQPNEGNMTLEQFNELYHKENFSSVSTAHKNNSSEIHHSAQIEGHVTNLLDTTEQNFTGDLTCLSGTFLPAPSVPGAAIKYIRTQTSPPLQSTVYLIAEYKCNFQYHLRDPSIYQLVCSQRRWVGEQPTCVPDEGTHTHKKECGEIKGECDHICEIISGATVCSCYRGFRLDDNMCKDINECEFSNGGCESGCRNTLGSYHCVCPEGLRIADDGKSCLDVNECLLRNGHGPCQDSCLNLWGSYECSCEGIQGTKLSADNHTCEDVDECADGTAGCSHTCLNTLGSAFCLCPAGFMLGDDWKTCQDINECAYEDLQTEHCELGCVNTIGSYHCLEKEEDTTGLQRTATELPVTCPEGMRPKLDGSCVDIDECEEKISGCTQSCLNTNGSFQCICGLGFSLSSDNKTCVDGAEEAVCPPLDAPLHGYLECARHLVRMRKSRYPWMKRARVVNHAGSVCQLKCPHGYILEGEYRKTCGQDKKWTGPENGTCVPLPAPSIRCPSNMTVSLKGGKTLMYVTIPQPVTNVNWYRYVEATPRWGKSLEANLPAGHWEVKFTARHPTSHLTASCILTISVISEN